MNPNQKIGRYNVEKELGEGTWGYTLLVYKVRYNKETGKQEKKYYVMKFIKINSISKQKVDEMIQLGNQLKELSQQYDSELYMISYYDIFRIENDTDKYLSIVMDYIEGENIMQQMGKGIDYNTMLLIMENVAKSLNFMHIHGIAHRNIKPENIVFDKKVSKWKLIDYSFSCTKSYIELCSRDGYDLHFQAPEILKNKNKKNEEFIKYLKADIWSLGVVFYELANNTYIVENKKDIAKTLLLIASNDIQINESLYEYGPINEIIHSMLNVNPNQRPTTTDLIFLIQIARPGCKINGIIYSHEEAQQILYSYGIDNKQWNDYDICSHLTNQLQFCNVGDNKYNQKELTYLASLLKIDSSKYNSSELCTLIQNKLQQNDSDYKEHVTSDLIRTISYLASLRTKELKNKLMSDAYDELQEKFKEEFMIARENNLIIVDMIKEYKNYTEKNYNYTLETIGPSFYTTHFNIQIKFIEELLKLID